MHAAGSLIAFTTLSGAGFGLLFVIGLGLGPSTNWGPWLACLLAAALTGGGLAASTRHLRRPERAWRAFSQWRSAWLSREAVLAAATLALFVLYAFGWLILGQRWTWIGLAMAAGAATTVFATSMIYASLATVPRWSRTPTPLLFLVLAGAGGLLAMSAVEAARGYDPTWTLWKAAVALIAAGLTAQLWHAKAAETGLAAAGATPEAATGLEGLGTVRPLESGHSAPSWVVREMVGTVGRRRARALTLAAIVLGLALPMALAKMTDLGMGRAWMSLALFSHLAGVAAHRWLFFAEAEHAVGAYYGRR